MGHLHARQGCGARVQPRRASLQARPLGLGILPLPEMLAILVAANPDLALSIELHPRTYDLPIFDREWLGFFPTAYRWQTIIGDPTGRTV